MKTKFTSSRARQLRATLLTSLPIAGICLAAVLAAGCGDDTPINNDPEPTPGLAPFTLDDRQVALVDNGIGPAGVRFEFQKAGAVRYSSSVEEQMGSYTYTTNSLNDGRAFLNFANPTTYFGNNARLDLAFTTSGQGLATVYSVGNSTNETTIIEQTTFLLTAVTNAPTAQQ